MQLGSWNRGVGAVSMCRTSTLQTTAEHSAVCWRAVDCSLEITAPCRFPILVPEGWIRGSPGLLHFTDCFYYLFQGGFLLWSGVRPFRRNHYLILRSVRVVPHCWVWAPAWRGRRHLGALAALALSGLRPARGGVAASDHTAESIRMPDRFLW